MSQDTAGPMARTVADVGAAADARWPASTRPIPSGAAANGKIAADYTTFLKADALKGKRFGVVRQAMGYHPDVDRRDDEGGRRAQGRRAPR